MVEQFVKKWDYEYNDHDISVIHNMSSNGRTRLIIDGTIQDSVKDPIGVFKLHGTLSSGEQVMLKINDLHQIAHMFKDAKDWAPRSVEVTVDGIQLEPKQVPVQAMNKASLEAIANGYDKLGRLSNEEFLAIKSLSKPVECTGRVSSAFLRFEDKQVMVAGESIQPGDNVVLENDFTKKKQFVDNITSFTSWQDGIFNKYYVENAEKCATNCDITAERKVIDAILDNSDIGLTAEQLVAIVGPDTTLAEYEAIRELRDGGIEITDQVLDLLAQGIEVNEITEMSYAAMQQEALEMGAEEMEQDEFERK